MEKNVSVIIPAYHAEKLISRTIESIINEGVPQQNIIVVEDGIFDKTKYILDKYHVQHIVFHRNRGAPMARNAGLEKVQTKYVMFIDSDDFVSHGLIKGLAETAFEKSADITFGPWRYEGTKIKPGALRNPPLLTTSDWIFFWLNNGIVPTCSVLWSTDSIRKINGWDERIKKNQDGELTIRAFLNGFTVGVCNEGYSTYWQHSSDHRVSESGAINRNFTSDVIYEKIRHWIVKKEKLSYEFELGKFCCKEAWMSFSENLNNEGEKWIKRARKNGYFQSGYSNNTNFLGKIFGIKYGAKIKAPLFKIIKNRTYK